MFSTDAYRFISSQHRLEDWCPMSAPQLLQFGLGDTPSVEIGVATEAEIATVTFEFAVDRDVRGQLDEWHLIAIRNHATHHVTLHLIGRYQPLRRLITSPVVGLATDRRRAKTLNSIYALAEPATEPPTRDTLLRVAARMLVLDSCVVVGDIARISGEVGHA
jgi:hypothetical protein